MGKFVKGDIVVINFPFSDLSGGKRRPALVISDLEGDDIILCQITSHSKMDKYAVSLEDADFINGKLSSASFVRLNKIFTADKNIILYTACSVKYDKFEEIIKILLGLFTASVN